MNQDNNNQAPQQSDDARRHKQPEFKDYVSRAFSSNRFKQPEITHLNTDAPHSDIDYTKKGAKSISELEEDAGSAQVRFQRNINTRTAVGTHGAYTKEYHTFAPQDKILAWNQTIRDDEIEIRGYDDLNNNPPAHLAVNNPPAHESTSQGGFFSRLAAKMGFGGPSKSND